MELLEAHAVDTYSCFVKRNRKRLAELPPPAVASSYYSTNDPYMFDDFQLRPPGSRRPPCRHLLDVFINICEDEGEHVKTMRACQDYAALGIVVTSPHLPPPCADESVDGLESSAELVQEGEQRRAAWKRWADQVHQELDSLAPESTKVADSKSNVSV
jgi:hypothetical protein